jgi:hypothetical protein
MSATATPYGLLPIRKIGSASNSTGLTSYKILNGYTTSIFYGDVVKLGSDGTIQKDTGTATATPLGVFMGCQYTDATMGFITRQYWPASTVATDAVALVCDDPDMVFKVQTNTSVATTDVGLNAALVQTAGSTATGKSAVAIGSLAATGTLPVRVIAIDTTTGNAAGDAYTDVHVIWNTPWLRNRDTGI